jgi:very-short-patch-repair endonuclease
MLLRPRTLRARRLRRSATDAEKLLWRALREQLPGYRFRRQHPIARYVVDFAYPARGGQHMVRQQQDSLRTANLGHRGYRVIRFWNSEVLQNLAGVLNMIRQELDS